jgi:hypothetical protein
MQWIFLLSQMIGGIGLLVIVLSIYPSKVAWSRVLRYNYASDRSAMEIVLTISRPIMFTVGIVLLAVSVIAGAVEPMARLPSRLKNASQEMLPSSSVTYQPVLTARMSNLSSLM